MIITIIKLTIIMIATPDIPPPDQRLAQVPMHIYQICMYVCVCVYIYIYTPIHVTNNNTTTTNNNQYYYYHYYYYHYYYYC